MILGLRVHHHSLMVPEYQMSGGVSTAAAIPLQGFLVDGVGWWYVGLDVLEDVTISPRNGGGHNGHGDTGEYAVRRGRKLTLGWHFSACV
jgi:hypothetical protein